MLRLVIGSSSTLKISIFSIPQTIIRPITKIEQEFQISHLKLSPNLYIKLHLIRITFLNIWTAGHFRVPLLMLQDVPKWGKDVLINFQIFGRNRHVLGLPYSNSERVPLGINFQIPFASALRQRGRFFKVALRPGKLQYMICTTCKSLQTIFNPKLA